MAEKLNRRRADRQQDEGLEHGSDGSIALEFWNAVRTSRTLLYISAAWSGRPNVSSKSNPQLKRLVI